LSVRLRHSWSAERGSGHSDFGLWDHRSTGIANHALDGGGRGADNERQHKYKSSWLYKFEHQIGRRLLESDRQNVNTRQRIRDKWRQIAAD
jgi:hypothetical protein